ncbi:MAG: ATP-binding cassette domain-containing protein [Acidimicrobiia bacterium]|nr:ATP-binding cassette domain-containing protein [Acidimicrobiia bacterium]
MTPGFELQGIGVRRDGVDVLVDVSVAIPTDGITVVAGPSGSGKSSLLRLLNRLDDPTAGVVRLDGADLRELDPRALRRRVGMVFQRPVVFEGSVLDNLRTVARDLEPPDAASRVAAVRLDPDLLDRDAARLSEGEAQRLSIARTLTTDPEVVLADEPTASLDAEARDGIEHLARSLDVSWVWVTHDIGQIERLADHVVAIDAGRVPATGSLAELRAHHDPAVRRVVTETT